MILFSSVSQVPTIDGTVDKGQVPASLTGDIDFVGVEFTYPTREEVKVKGHWTCTHKYKILCSYDRSSKTTINFSHDDFKFSNYIFFFY
jgi:hypothetical protein